MKTKIIYISGNEIFNMNDIRNAFEEVRCALNLDKNTVLFGVPVDSDDACLMKENPDTIKNESVIPEEISQEPEITIPETTVINEEIIKEEKPEVKKRGRPRKEEIIEDVKEETVIENEVAEEPITEEEKNIPILSVLSVNEETVQDTIPETAESAQEIEIIPEITEEKNSETIVEETIDSEEDTEPDLEKLLSEMTPLQEDTLEEIPSDKIIQPTESEDISVDATLEQLATEFVENQDKIKEESKTQSRSKIGKLRNILPFKQSKHKDQGIGDLLEWAGIAANDEDFSVPGFFTNAASKR